MEFNLKQVQAAMAVTNDLFNSEVFGKANFDAFDDIYTANARILPPGGAMITGRPAIKEFWLNTIQAIKAKSAVLTSVEVTPAGDGIVEIGKAVLTAEPDATMEVKYVVYWKQEEGKWKWDIDIWNFNA